VYNRHDIFSVPLQVGRCESNWLSREVKTAGTNVINGPSRQMFRIIHDETNSGILTPYNGHPDPLNAVLDHFGITWVMYHLFVTISSYSKNHQGINGLDERSSTLRVLLYMFRVYAQRHAIIQNLDGILECPDCGRLLLKLNRDHIHSNTNPRPRLTLQELCSLFCLQL